MSNPRRIILVYAALGLITLAVYWPALRCDFVSYDDNDYVTANPHVQSGLTKSNLAWAFTTGHASNWHPLTWISHMIDCRIFGLHPWGHHLTNLLFHAANTLLLFGLMRRMTGNLWRSAFVAALFGWHPLHVESVAWIAERKDVLSTCFWMLTLLAYVRYVELSKVQSPPRRERAGFRSKVFYVLALVLFALGLMAKPMLVTLPFVLLLLDYWPLRRLTPPQAPGARFKLSSMIPLFVEKLPFFALSLASCIVTYRIQLAGGAVHNSNTGLDLSLRIENALLACTGYVAKIFWPTRLTVIYPYDLSPPDLEIIGAGLLIAAITLGVLIFGRQRPYLPMGWFFFLGTLVPVIGVVQVGVQSMADRYTYIPAIGVFIMIAWGIPELLARWPQWNRTLGAGASLALAGCLAVTLLQLRYWQNSENLFRRAIEVTRDNTVAVGYLGAALSERGKLDEAMVQFNEALRLNQFNFDAHNNLAIALEKQGKFDEAATHYEEILRVNQQNAGGINAKVCYNYGAVLKRMGKTGEAEARFAEALRLDPEFVAAQLQLELLRAARSRGRESISHYREALRLMPEATDVLNNLAWLLATNPDPALRDGPEAVRLARHVCDLTKNDEPQLLGTLAAAYAEAGEFDQAIASASKARDLATAKNLPAVATRNEELLKLYQDHQAYHEPAETVAK